jgi:putative ABC transport system permease protein
MAGLSVDSRVLGFTAVISLMTGLLFGIAPAIQNSGIDLNESLKEGGHTTSSGHKIRSTLIVFEVAVSLMLLIGSGLLIKSLSRLVNSNTGFDPNNVVTMLIATPRVKYDKIVRRTEFHRQLIERVSALPGVEHVGVSVNLPGFTDGWQNDIAVEGYGNIKPGELLNVDWSIVSDGFFDTMKIPIRQGRTFTRQEAEEGKYVVVVDETLAKRFWPNGDAVGKHIAYDDHGWQEIIGVANTIDYFGSEVRPRMKMYTPIGKNDQNRMYLSVRTSQADSAGIANAIVEQAHQLDKDVSVSAIATMDDLLSREASPKRFNTILFGVFAAVALILAAVGIYGVMSYTVNQRTHEIGIRMALGAQTSDVFRLIIGRGMTRILIGITLGLFGSFAFTRVMKSLLFGVSATDPITFAYVTLVIICVALLACYLPTRRVTQIDPAISLRAE